MENTIGRWCQEHGYILLRVFRDVARSGTKTAGRDAFLEMVEYLASSPPEAGVVFWEYARLSRDYDDLMFSTWPTCGGRASSCIRSATRCPKAWTAA